MTSDGSRSRAKNWHFASTEDRLEPWALDSLSVWASTLLKCDNRSVMTSGSDEGEERPISGGKAAERLRQFLAERFGEEGPPIPPDEEQQPEEKAPSEPPDDAAGRG